MKHKSKSKKVSLLPFQVEFCPLPKLENKLLSGQKQNKEIAKNFSVLIILRVNENMYYFKEMKV